MGIDKKYVEEIHSIMRNLSRSDSSETSRSAYVLQRATLSGEELIYLAELYKKELDENEKEAKSSAERESEIRKEIEGLKGDLEKRLTKIFKI